MWLLADINLQFIEDFLENTPAVLGVISTIGGLFVLWVRLKIRSENLKLSQAEQENMHYISLSKRNDVLEEDVKALREISEKQAKTISDLELTVTTQSANYDRLQDELIQRQQQVSNLQSLITKMQEELIQLREQNTLSQSRIRDLEQDMSDIRRERDMALAELRGVKDTLKIFEGSAQVKSTYLDKLGEAQKTGEHKEIEITSNTTVNPTDE